MFNKKILAIAITALSISVSGYAIAEKPDKLIRGELGEKLKSKKISDDESLDVVIVLKSPKEDQNVEAQVSELEVNEAGAATIKVDGREISTYDQEYLVEKNRYKSEQKKLERIKFHRKQWEDVNQRVAGPLFDKVGRAARAGGQDLKLSVRKRDIQSIAENYGDLIAGIELATQAVDEASIVEARKWTRVENDAFDLGAKGEGIGIYVVEANSLCPTAADLGLSTSTYYKDPATGDGAAHGKMVIDILNKVAPEADIYCGKNVQASLNSAILDGTAATNIDPIYIATYSFANPSARDENNNSIYDGTYTSGDKNLGNEVYIHGIAVFKSAGNLGNSQQWITTPGKDANVITVGATQQSCGSDGGPFQIKCWNRWSGSSWKDPETGADKPEISAPGHNITAGGSTASGTSLSAPHAAAFAANMMSISPYFKLKPAALKAAMLASARDKINKNSDLSNSVADMVGVGGINYRNFTMSWKNKHWKGGNSSYFDANKEVIYTTDLGGTQTVRAALAWLNNPQYTYDNKTIGMELDLYVYNPAGTLVGSSTRNEAGFEFVDFTTTSAGTYTFKIKRRQNNDSSARVDMSIHIEYSGA